MTTFAADKQAEASVDIDACFGDQSSSNVMPTLDFHSFPMDVDSLGNISTFSPEHSSDSQISQPQKFSTASSNNATAFFRTRGFGWLLEVTTDDDDDTVPLLQDLDVNLLDIYHKILSVLLPCPIFHPNNKVRGDPDFWGPLFVVLVYALVSLYGQFQVISWILTIWIVGSFLVFLLARVLGGDVTFSQCLGIIGYCLMPLVLVGALLPLAKDVYILTVLFKIAALVWAVYSAGSLLCGDDLKDKKLLLLYPILLLGAFDQLTEFLLKQAFAVPLGLLIDFVISIRMSALEFCLEKYVYSLNPIADLSVSTESNDRVVTSAQNANAVCLFLSFANDQLFIHSTPKHDSLLFILWKRNLKAWRKFRIKFSATTTDSASQLCEDASAIIARYLKVEAYDGGVILPDQSHFSKAQAGIESAELPMALREQSVEVDADWHTFHSRIQAALNSEATICRVFQEGPLTDYSLDVLVRCCFADKSFPAFVADVEKTLCRID